jgi:hypothetical protein
MVGEYHITPFIPSTGLIALANTGEGSMKLILAGGKRVQSAVNTPRRHERVEELELSQEHIFWGLPMEEC